jgi:hypothetical protein
MRVGGQRHATAALPPGNEPVHIVGNFIKYGSKCKIFKTLKY